MWWSFSTYYYVNSKQVLASLGSQRWNTALLESWNSVKVVKNYIEINQILPQKLYLFEKFVKFRNKNNFHRPTKQGAGCWSYSLQLSKKSLAPWLEGIDPPPSSQHIGTMQNWFMNIRLCAGALLPLTFLSLDVGKSCKKWLTQIADGWGSREKWHSVLLIEHCKHYRNMCFVCFSCLQPLWSRVSVKCFVQTWLAAERWWLGKHSHPPVGERWPPQVACIRWLGPRVSVLTLWGHFFAHECFFL